MKRAYPYLVTDPFPFGKGQAKALVCAVGATAVRAALDPFIDSGLYFTFVFPAIFIAGFWGGNRAAITTALLGGLLSGFFWIPPRFSLNIDKSGWTQIVVYASSASVQLLVVAIVNGLVQALEAAERKSVALANEMQHRSLNILALVQAIARQTLRSGAGADDKALFEERIGALARSHQLLRESGRDVVELGRLLKEIVQPFDSARIALTGPPCFIEGNAGTSIVMLFHELATNAVKYGALSVETGAVSVAWKLLDGQAHVTWQEKGGPPVAKPERTGSGSRLMQAIFADQPGLVFLEEGVNATISIPLAQMGGRDPRPDALSPADAPRA